MYSLDTVVSHTKNIFVKKVVLDVKKLNFWQMKFHMGVG